VAWLLLSSVLVIALVALAAGALWGVRANRRYQALAEARLEARRAEARLEVVVRDTISRLFDAARHQP